MAPNLHGRSSDGNLVSLSDNDSKLTYQYDALNRLRLVSTKDSPKQPAIFQQYSYDQNSNRSNLTAGFLEGKESIDAWITQDFYVYDKENQLTQIFSRFRPINLFFEYDDLSRMTKIKYPNGMRAEISYEGDTRLSKIEHKGFFSVQSVFSYQYDNNDNKIQTKTFRRALPVNEVLNYTYDRKDQLLTATNPLRNLDQETFTYDITGNLLRKQGQSQDSVYNTNNQLTEDEDYIYKYDIKGNMVEKKHKTDNIITRYHWDIENQLTKITTHETETAMPSETITYAYDALGRRIEKNINGKIKRYIYDNEDILLEFDGEDLLKKHYVHGLGVDNPLAMFNRKSDQTNEFEAYYYHKDGMGSITSLTDKDKKEVEKYVYDAFGKMTIYDERDNKIEESKLGNPYSFTGREHDSETGLHYHRARYYDPDLARWISEDPIDFDSNMNLYLYAMNNPMNYTDPNGESPRTAIFVTKAGIGAAIFSYYYLELLEFNKVKDKKDAAGGDKYFHCVANCFTEVFTRDESIAFLISEFREAKSDAKTYYGNIGETCQKKAEDREKRKIDKKFDRIANRLGIEISNRGGDCKRDCIDAVDDKYIKTKQRLRQKYF